MASIFLSYAHEDKTRAQSLAKALEAEGWSIFWDRTIPTGGTWREHIGEALHEAKCVVVAWSKASVESNWVHEEADEGRERKILVPVLLENVKPPLGFRSIQAETLVDWDGSPTAGEFRKLVADIQQLLGPPPNAPLESTPKNAATEPQQESPTVSQELQQKASRAQPTVSKSSQPERGSTYRLSDVDKGSRPAVLSRTAIAGAIGLVLIMGLAWLTNIENNPPADSSNPNSLSAKSKITPDYLRNQTGEQQTSREVESYLQKAENMLEKGHVRTGMGEEGAIFYYKAVLRKEPENQTAILGLKNIIDDALRKLRQKPARQLDGRIKGDSKRYFIVIADACDEPFAALRSKCSVATQHALGHIDPAFMESVNVIRNIGR